MYTYISIPSDWRRSQVYNSEFSRTYALYLVEKAEPQQDS
jgi:hypothetical protein